MRKNKSRTATSSQQSALVRYRKVKLAADASMAAAVGPRRVWSRAMLWKIRSRGVLARRRGRRSCGHGVVRRRRVHMGKRGGKLGFGGDPKTEELRRLVPGGEAMDLYSLLDETAHYMKCLSTQPASPWQHKNAGELRGGSTTIGENTASREIDGDCDAEHGLTTDGERRFRHDAWLPRRGKEMRAVVKAEAGMNLVHKRKAVVEGFAEAAIASVLLGGDPDRGGHTASRVIDGDRSNRT
ncbi:hypothetical protein RHSIM_Rhsim13G0052900 [Rhododendron simsii]|uniref:IBH1-like N-terminal domain-containing protein n=1 Tax=Rhododendron simsii TaxID=118357 RepID=A0A834G1N2_RHOSS|nr:hypothetical protein RHSIM_Rhsim13G0052900 [Rhododendron simsii]